MAFSSILFEDPNANSVWETDLAPDCFADLNLDQIVEAATRDKREYNLRPFYHTPLKDHDTIQYRQEIARDLENANLLDSIKAFASQMNATRRYLTMASELTYRYHRQGWFLEAVAIYTAAIASFARDLRAIPLSSRGLLAFRNYLTNYAASDQFVTLEADTGKLKADLGAITYSVLINGNHVTVSQYQSQIDYSADVEALFAKFRQGVAKDYSISLGEGSGMSYVEAQILDLVARLYPDVFAGLSTFCQQHNRFVDETVRDFDRQIQFYISYLDYIADIQQAGLRFCYPRVVTDDKAIHSEASFDLALAKKLVAAGMPMVCNNFHLEGQERIFVVSGPNQGGKTTFARAFGQLHYLASLGCPVPGTQAQLFLFDGLFTHFDREEDIRNLRGKLEDDLIRIHNILRRATGDSILIMNELFTSTTLLDATLLGRQVMQRIAELDSLGVYVTFVDELAAFDSRTVSVVSTVDPDDPTLRTYKIVRKHADGLAYALSLAAKHRLTYESLTERLR